MRIFIYFFIFFFIWTSQVVAGGAAARQTQGVRVQRQIQLNPQAVQTPAPSRSETEKIEIPEEPKQEPTILPKIQPQVLVSTPFFKDTKKTSASLPNNPGTMDNQAWAQIFQQLEQNSDLWLHLYDIRLKILIVSGYISWYEQHGVKITKSPMQYALLINNIFLENPALSKQPFKNILRMVAVIEYDFNNGQDKDSLARSLLDPQAFLRNKKRLKIK